MKVLEQINAMPRAARWGLIGALVLAGYFVVIEPVLALTAKFEDEASAARASLNRQQELRQGKDQTAREIKTGIRRFGTVEFPPSGSDASARLLERINAVCEEFGVTPRDITAGSRQMPEALLAGVRPPATRVYRYMQTVQLEAAPDTVLKIIAALEQSEDVSGLGQLQLRRSPKEGSKTVEVTLTVEAWGLEAARTSSGGGA